MYSAGSKTTCATLPYTGITIIDGGETTFTHETNAAAGDLTSRHGTLHAGAQHAPHTTFPKRGAEFPQADGDGCSGACCTSAGLEATMAAALLTLPRFSRAITVLLEEFSWRQLRWHKLLRQLLRLCQVWEEF